MKIFAKLTELLEEMNERVASFGVKFGVREEYAIEYLEQIQQQYVVLCGIDPTALIRGRGHRKTTEQRHYDKLSEYILRMKKYAEHIRTCLHKPSARLCDNLLPLPALKILEIRQYSCGFLPCHRQNLAANPHTGLVKTGSKNLRKRS